MGETPKNVSAIFRAARDEGAVLFFDEADAIASRRSTSVHHGFQRESNTVVSVLLQELERYNGVVIFATNLAANFDPAFERRIRTHVLFEMPGAVEREQIWRVQMHPSRTPLADDVDLRSLAEKYAVSGGDIRNAVLKAALAAAAEPGPDSTKRIHQRHLEAGITDVVSAGRVMQQSLFTDKDRSAPPASRLLAYGLALAGTALVVAIIALAVAQRNVSDYGLAGRINLIRSDLFDNVPAKSYDLVISNPPYVTTVAMEELPPEYRREPALALAGGDDGLDAVHVILRKAPQFMERDGLLVVEVGHNRSATELSYPRVPFVWLETATSADSVFLLKRENMVGAT